MHKNVWKVLLVLWVFHCSFTGDKDKLKGGIYKTGADFAAGKLTDAGEFKSVFHNDNNWMVKFKSKTGNAPVHLTEFDDWGFRTDDGIDYRVFKGNPRGVILSGRVFYYGGIVAFTRDKYDKILTVRSEHFDFGISKGPDGEILEATDENLKELLSGQPVIIQRFEEGEIDILGAIRLFNYMQPATHDPYQNVD